MPAPFIDLTQIADYGSGTPDLMALTGGQITGRHGYDGASYGAERETFAYQQGRRRRTDATGALRLGPDPLHVHLGSNRELLSTTTSSPEAARTLDHSDGYGTPNAGTGLYYQPFADSHTRTFFLYLQFSGAIQCTATLLDNSTAPKSIMLGGPAATRTGIRCIYRGLTAGSHIDIRLSNTAANQNAWIAPQFWYLPPYTAAPHYRGSAR
jgi:hypothetical protein